MSDVRRHYLHAAAEKLFDRLTPLEREYINKRTMLDVIAIMHTEDIREIMCEVVDTLTHKEEETR